MFGDLFFDYLLEYIFLEWNMVQTVGVSHFDPPITLKAEPSDRPAVRPMAI